MTTDQICLEAIDRGYVDVDPVTGQVRAVRFHNRVMGCSNTKGYMVSRLHVDGQSAQIKLHRLIWLFCNRHIPSGFVIDHINGIKSDNRIVNLRLANPALNSQNRRSYSGTGNPAAKINQSIADAIRNRYSEVKSYRKVARDFCISVSLVAMIIRNEKWVNDE